MSLRKKITLRKKIVLVQEMDCSSNLNRDLPFHIDLNEAPLPSPREIERGLFIEHPEESSSRVKSVVTTPSQSKVRVCSSCEFGSSFRKDEQKEEWKCFKCVLGGRRRSSDDGGSGAAGCRGGEVVELLDMNSSPPLDMNVFPPMEPEGERVFQFVDLNEDLPVAGREVEQNNGAKS